MSSVYARLWEPYEAQLGRGQQLLKEIPWCASVLECATLSDGDVECHEFMERFSMYEKLDADYLRSFIACIAVLLAKLPDDGTCRKLGVDIVTMLKCALNEHVLVANNSHDCDSNDKEVPTNSPSFTRYIEYINNIAGTALRVNHWLPEADQSVFALAVALTPCMILYAHIGRELGKLLSAGVKDESEPNPCKAWINLYASSVYQTSVAKIEVLVEALAGLLMSHGVHESYLYSLAQPIYAQAMEYEMAIFREFAIPAVSLEYKHIKSLQTPYPKLLFVAGSDSGGGAGIQADVKAAEAYGVFSATAVVAITAQNTIGVQAVRVLDEDIIHGQISSVISDYEDLKFVKTGMLPDAATVNAVYDELFGGSKGGRLFHLVVDPVLLASSGDLLADESAVDAIKRKLLNRCLICTPNAPEFALLLGIQECEVYGDKSDDHAMRFLSTFGCRSVLVKGGHADDDVVTDSLYISMEGNIPFPEYKQVQLSSSLASKKRAPLLDITTDIIGQGRVFKLNIKHPRIRARNHAGHGTGCTLASSITACLVKLDLQYSSLRDGHVSALCHATVSAVIYVHKAMERAQNVDIGKGNGPLVHHLLH
eukprot:CFRG3192T1